MRYILITLVLCALVAGCAPGQKSATEQLMEQTKNPAVIAMGAYSDALESYKLALSAYDENAMMIEATDPRLNDEILGQFQRAWDILKDWKRMGVPPAGGDGDLRRYLRTIALQIAMAIDGVSVVEGGES